MVHEWRVMSLLINSHKWWDTNHSDYENSRVASLFIKSDESWVTSHSKCDESGFTNCESLAVTQVQLMSHKSTQVPNAGGIAEWQLLSCWGPLVDCWLLNLNCIEVNYLLALRSNNTSASRALLLSWSRTGVLLSHLQSCLNCLCLCAVCPSEFLYFCISVNHSELSELFVTLRCLSSLYVCLYICVYVCL